MDYRFMIDNFKEAMESIEDLLELMEEGGEYSAGDEDAENNIRFSLWHIYHHLNLGWNQRHVTDAEVAAARWEIDCQWPRDMDDVIQRWIEK